MSLTIHYTLTAPGVGTEREALRLVRGAHRIASRMQAEGIFKAVGKVGFGGRRPVRRDGVADSPGAR
jgi:hypothetical protein